MELNNQNQIIAGSGFLRTQSESENCQFQLSKKHQRTNNFHVRTGPQKIYKNK
jgi:hypothetical protein